MKILSSYYINFSIADTYKIPSSLRDVLYEAWQNSYEELYEESKKNTTSLEETCVNILNAFNDNDVEYLHHRYLCMAIIMSEKVKPTIKTYLPNDSRTEKSLNYLHNFLEKEITLSNFEIITIINQLFPDNSEGCQAIDEALDVFKNLLRVLDFGQAKEALLNILDDCFEGYAIFPGSEGRRDLFNWWLLEVIPASWCLEFPNKLHNIKGFQQIKILKRE